MSNIPLDEFMPRRGIRYFLLVQLNRTKHKLEIIMSAYMLFPRLNRNIVVRKSCLFDFKMNELNRAFIRRQTNCLFSTLYMFITTFLINLHLLLKNRCLKYVGTSYRLKYELNTYYDLRDVTLILSLLSDIWDDTVSCYLTKIVKLKSKYLVHSYNTLIRNILLRCLGHVICTNSLEDLIDSLRKVSNIISEITGTIFELSSLDERDEDIRGIIEEYLLTLTSIEWSDFEELYDSTVHINEIYESLIM